LKKTQAKQKKSAKNLEVSEKVPIFAPSERSFDYPGRIPRGSKTEQTLLPEQDITDTTPF
jgi:hypothetical protein